MRRAMASSVACCGAAAGAGCACALAVPDPSRERAKQDATRNARRKAIIVVLRGRQSYAARSPGSRERIPLEAHHQGLHAFREGRMHELGVDDCGRLRAGLQQRNEDVDQLPRLCAADENAEDPFALRIEEDLAT